MRCVKLLLLLSFAAGCATGPAASPSSGMHRQSIDPNLAMYLSNPDARGADLSPDGKTVALISTVKDSDILITWDIESGKKAAILRFPHANAQLEHLMWANDGRILIAIDTPYVRSTGVRARSSLLYGLDVDGDNLRHLGRKWFGRSGRQAQDLVQLPIQNESNILSLLPNDPEHILLQLTKPADRYPGVYKLNVDSGRIKRIVRPQDRVRHWYADTDGVVRLGVGRQDGKRWIVARKSQEEDFALVEESKVFEESSLDILGFTFEPQIIIVSSDHEGDREATYEFDLTTRTFGRKLFEHDRVDVDHGLRIDPVRRVVEGIEYIDEGPEVYFLDQEASDLQAAIDRALPGRDNRISSRSRDGRRMLVASGSHNAPPQVFYFDRDAGSMDLLFSAYPMLEDKPLAPMRAVYYTARDGLEIPAFLTTPANRPEENLPLLVIPHGGPTLRDDLRYDREVQFFASRGYAVFQPNFRGSSGYGAIHETLGYKNWGLTMQDDITDGVRWLIAEGIADENRIAIYGASYGGYAALMGVAKDPDLYRCGASLAGVTDLVAHLSSDKWYTGLEDLNTPKIGDTWKDKERLRQTSPIHNVDKIVAPVLVAHGEADWRVHVDQARSFADAMEGAGKQVELIVFEDEIHGLRNVPNRLEFYSRLIAFLDQHMKP